MSKSVVVALVLVVSSIIGCAKKSSDSSSTTTPNPTTYSIAQEIIPCGIQSGSSNQVYLQLSNGDILGSVQGSGHRDTSYLAILVPGTYQTLDQKHCSFIVNSDGSVSW